MTHACSLFSVHSLWVWCVEVAQKEGGELIPGSGDKGGEAEERSKEERRFVDVIRLIQKLQYIQLGPEGKSRFIVCFITIP